MIRDLFLFGAAASLVAGLSSGCRGPALRSVEVFGRPPIDAPLWPHDGALEVEPLADLGSGQPVAPGPLLRAQFSVPPGLLACVEISALQQRPLPSVHSRPSLAVGLAGSRLRAVEVDRKGRLRRYRAVVPPGSAQSGELTVWAAEDHRAAGLELERVVLARLTPSPRRIAARLAESRWWRVESGLEARVARLLLAGGSIEAPLEMPVGSRLRFGWAALGAPRGPIAVRASLLASDGSELAHWSGSRLPGDGWLDAEVTPDRSPHKVARVRIAATGVGAVALDGPRLVMVREPPVAPSLVLVMVGRLPGAGPATLEALPEVSRRSRSMIRTAVWPAAISSRETAASVLSGLPGSRHQVALGARPPLSDVLPAQLAAGGYTTRSFLETVIEDGSSRVVRFPGGLPTSAPERLAESVGLALVEEASEPFAVVAHLAGSAPPWPAEGGLAIGHRPLRAPPDWILLLEPFVRSRGWDRPALASEVARFERAAASRTDRALAVILEAAARSAAADRLLVAVVDLGDAAGASEPIAPGLLLLSGPGLQGGGEVEGAARAIDVAATLRELLDLPHRGVAGESLVADLAAGSIAARPFEIGALERDGSITLVDSEGAPRVVSLSPWFGSGPDPHRGTPEAAVLLRDLRAGLAGYVVRVETGAIGRTIEITGESMRPEGFLRLSGEALGTLDVAARVARWRLGPQQSLELLVAAGAGAERLSVDGVGASLRSSRWTVEESSQGTLAVREGEPGARILARVEWQP